MISGASGRASVFIGSGQGLEMIFDEKILKEHCRKIRVTWSEAELHRQREHCFVGPKIEDSPARMDRPASGRIMIEYLTTDVAKG